MDKLERGKRNIEKLEAISDFGNGQDNRGKIRIVLWNPDENNKQTVTVDFLDARVLTQLYHATKEENREAYLRKIATASGFLKFLKFGWEHSHFYSRSMVISGS